MGKYDNLLEKTIHKISKILKKSSRSLGCR